MIKRLLILAAAIGLSGCISLFPKAEPATLYKLTAATGASAVAAEPARATVLKAPTAFTRVGSTDRILTTRGAESAFLADARWAAPAQVMFDEALVSAFTAAAPGVRLVTRGEATAADQILRVEVRTFEAQYRGGKRRAPTVVVEARASLTNLRNRTPAGDQIFRAEAPASANRVGAVVSAFDVATAKVLGDIARWAEAQALAKAPA
jgi:cholesterol transport system auxiliary component